MTNGVVLVDRVSALERKVSNHDVRLEQVEIAFVYHSKEVNRRLTHIEELALANQIEQRLQREDIGQMATDIRALTEKLAENDKIDAVQTRDILSVRVKAASIPDLERDVHVMKTSMKAHAVQGGKIIGVITVVAAVWEALRPIILPLLGLE